MSVEHLRARDTGTRPSLFHRHRQLFPLKMIRLHYRLGYSPSAYLSFASGSRPLFQIFPYHPTVSFILSYFPRFNNVESPISSKTILRVRVSDSRIPIPHHISQILDPGILDIPYLHNVETWEHASRTPHVPYMYFTHPVHPKCITFFTHPTYSAFPTINRRVIVRVSNFLHSPRFRYIFCSWNFLHTFQLPSRIYSVSKAKDWSLDKSVERGGRGHLLWRTCRLNEGECSPKSSSGYWCFLGRAGSSNVMTIMSFPWAQRAGTWRSAFIQADKGEKGAKGEKGV